MSYDRHTSQASPAKTAKTRSFEGASFTNAIGFDLGETLLSYEGVPQSWSPRYREAFAAVAAACGQLIKPFAVTRAVAVLERYNTRLAPRVREVPEGEIFAEVTAALGLQAGDCEMVADAFFAFFRRRVAAYPETLAVLRQLRSLNLAVGVLTDVPYGMARARVEADLAAAGMDDLVTVLLTSVDVGHRKPDSAGFIRLAAELGVQVCDLLCVGTSRRTSRGQTKPALGRC